MQVHKTTFILMLLASLTTACTTDFTTSDTGQDTSVDTTDDTTADGTPDVDPDGPDVVPDLTDVPMDTGTDVPPPDPITCHAEEGFWYEVPEGELLTWGCDDLGDCSHVNLWLTFANQTLVAMIGADRVEGVEKPGFFATLIDPESMAVVANGQVTMPFEAENTWYSLSGGSVVQGQTDEASVIFTSRTSTGGTTPETQNLRVVTIFDDLDVLSYQVHVLLNGMMPSGENGQLSQPRVIRSSWGEYYVFVMIEEESPLFMNNQLYGATFSTADFTDVGSSFQFGVRFQELQPVRNQSFFPGLPDEMDGNIVMPYMHLDMNEDIGSYHAGLWIQDDPITPGSPPGPIESMELMSSCAYDSQLAGVAFDDRGRYGMAALCSSSRFSMSGISPPYALNSASIDTLVPGTGIDGNAVLDISESAWRDLEFIDLLDPQALLDPAREIYHYVNVFYTGDKSIMRIYSFDGEGRFATAPDDHFQMDTPNPVLPAFDATIRHDTSRIYFAHMDYPGDSYGYISGFIVTPIVCE